MASKGEVPYERQPCQRRKSATRRHRRRRRCHRALERNQPEDSLRTLIAYGRDTGVASSRRAAIVDEDELPEAWNALVRRQLLFVILEGKPKTVADAACGARVTGCSTGCPVAVLVFDGGCDKLIDDYGSL